MALTKEQIKNLKPGDIVREVSWEGIEPAGLGNVYEVEEVNNTIIMLRNNPCNIALAPCFLELVYSKDVTADIEHEVFVNSTGYRFKVIVDNMDSYSHRVKDTHTSRVVAVFPYCNPPFDDELTERAAALKRATDYCKCINEKVSNGQPY